MTGGEIRGIRGTAREVDRGETVRDEIRGKRYERRLEGNHVKSLVEILVRPPLRAEMTVSPPEVDDGSLPRLLPRTQTKNIALRFRTLIQDNCETLCARIQLLIVYHSSEVVRDRLNQPSSLGTERYIPQSFRIKQSRTSKRNISFEGSREIVRLWTVCGCHVFLERFLVPGTQEQPSTSRHKKVEFMHCC